LNQFGKARNLFNLLFHLFDTFLFFDLLISRSAGVYPINNFLEKLNFGSHYYKSRYIFLYIFIYIPIFIFQLTVMFVNTDGPHYMWEIGTLKIDSNITNLHIKRPRITINSRIGFRKKTISQLHIRKIADKKITYNEGRLYFNPQLNIKNNITQSCHFFKMNRWKSNLSFFKAMYFIVLLPKLLKDASGIHSFIWITLKLRCDIRFQRAFTACSCVFKVITLIWANQRNYFENATACSKRTLKTTVATQL